MTDGFEVTERDGAARLGELRLSPPVTTPATVDGRIADPGSRWSGREARPEPSADVVTLAPHRGMPPGTADAVVEAFAPEPMDLDGPSGVVIDARTATDLGADVYVLSTAQGIVGHAEAFRDAIVETRTGIPDDTALYLSGVATPANVATLAYAGVDLVDTARARIAGSRGRYLTTDGARHLDELAELPCTCHACVDGADPEGLGTDGCVDHNVACLEAALGTVRERIRAGRLREYVSAECRHVPWLTATLRSFDDERAYLEERTPLYRRAEMLATTEDDLHRPEVRRFIDRVRERYLARFRTPVVLLPCSASKPYSDSQSYRQFRGAIEHRAHRVSISSPIGVVPQELECTYPAQHYDVPVTGRWTPGERTIVGEALEAYLADREHRYVIAHVPPGAYRDVVEAAAEAADIDVTYTVTDHPTTPASLEALEEALEGELKYSKRDRRQHTVKALADYQFGPGAGDELFADVSIDAPYPKHRVLNADGELLATMVPGYGLLALTLEGARHWMASDVPVRRVTIDDFVPHGDVLAPGIRDADPSIRVGDEVIVEGPSAFGIGRARMPGRALAESTRGVAVDLRHSEERD